MKAPLAVVVLLWVTLSPSGLADQPRLSYTTLIIDYVGKQDRYIPPILISTSSEEAEWYKQHVLPLPLVHAEIVPASLLAEITELPPLKRELEDGKPVGIPKTSPSVNLTAGAGHTYVEVTLDAENSMMMLQDIEKRVPQYPKLQSQIRELIQRVRHSR